MSPFGLELYDWLAQKDGVYELKDESTKEYGDALRFTYRGKAHFITIDSAESPGHLADPRAALDEVNNTPCDCDCECDCAE